MTSLSSSEIDLAIIMLPPILLQISAEIYRQRCVRIGEALNIRPGELLAPWTFKVKFSYGTQFLFGTLMFTIGEDGTLKLLARGPAPSHHKPIYGEAPYYPAEPRATLAPGGARSGLNPYVGLYTSTAITSWGHPIGVPASWSSIETVSSTSLGTSTSRKPAAEAHRISMVGPDRAASHNNSNKYTTIKGSKVFDAWTPSNRVVRNLNPDFNIVRLQTIKESIQRLVPRSKVKTLHWWLWPSQGLSSGSDRCSIIIDR
jgi:hypothetical protein